MTQPKPSIENHASRPQIFGAPEGQDARILADMARDLSRTKRVAVHIASDDLRAHALMELIAFFAPDVESVYFPAWDCLPYDRVSPSPDIIAARVNGLNRLLQWRGSDKFLPRILITTIGAVMQRVTPIDSLQNAGFSVAEKGRVNVAGLQQYLVKNGYTRTDTVREQGEFAVRGGIVDLFPPMNEMPVRIDLFGDDVESLRFFDPATQRTEGNLREVSLRPVSEFFLDEDSIARFRGRYRETFGAVTGNDPLYEAVSEGRKYNGADHWMPLFFEKMNTVFDYVAGGSVTLDQFALAAYTERKTQVKDFFDARKTLADAAQKKGKKKDSDASFSGTVYHALAPSKLYLSDDEWEILTENAAVFLPYASPDEIQSGAKKSRDFGDIRALPDGDLFGELKKHLAYLNRKTLIACYSEGSRERLKIMMEHAGIDPLPSMEILSLEHGFTADDLAVLTEQDILGDRLARKQSRRKKSENFLTEVSALKAGDLVVHQDHGIGRFEGLETLKAGGLLHDCLKITYDGGDRLFVPVENIEILSRFGADEGFTQLDKLGGAGWQARKAKVKKDLMVMAEGLLKIAAQRLLKKGEKLSVDADSYNLFSMRFPYQETEDQLKSINDVVADLNGEQPMDRLVCGDVGFGKTEVALRAAYVAAMAGAQVAVVVPTTLLSRQHYNNFSARFAGTGLRVEQLSRMVSTKDAKSTRDGLSDGRVNIVVGTHAVFAKDTKFAHLGLLIVDEEQRFGVKQKERLKEIKTDVHVLTLSATPIPRTLQMSLTGVKDLSLITTPPVDRLAIRTFVLPFDPLVIREAIMREHYRGGQTFYVCPRIGDMEDIEKTLKDLVPEVKIITAHGQMTPTELEDRMTAFYEGQYDILLATNIIESGIDIPRANTMVIHRADMFGLAQLYQIRGRIGRSKVRAYAYLTFEPTAKLTATAQKRLEVIETLDTLGAGFQLASHDMDIRGAGNLLGEEQSGHIKEVGVELYQQMLEDAVAAARAGVSVEEITSDQWSPTINLGLSVLIPETYVEDLGVRMSLYRRLADLEDETAVESFAAELIDRFGKIPAEVENLLDIVRIKQLCRTANVDKVEGGPKGAVIGFRGDSPPNIGGLMTWIQNGRGTVKLRADQKLVAVRSWDLLEDRVRGIQKIMKELAGLAA